MDSQHRHELEQNDLAEFITHFRDWWIKHGMRTLLLVLVAVIAIFLWQTKKRNDKLAHDNAWYDLSTATSPETYHAVAREQGVKAIQILAHLRAADAAMVDALGGEKPAAALPTLADAPKHPEMTEEDRTKLLQQAQADYQKVADDGSAATAFRLNAMLGLAAVAESLGNWDEARAHYDAIQIMAGDMYEAIAAQAGARAAVLERVAVPVIFAPEPPAIEVVDPADADPVATQPAETQPAAPQPADNEQPAE